MDDEFRKQVYDYLNTKETNELVEIWQTNNRAVWSEVAFGAIREILIRRLGELPPQRSPTYEKVEEDDYDAPVWKGTYRKFFTSTMFLTLGLFFIGFGFIVLGGIINQAFFDGNMPDKLFNLFPIIASFFVLACGVFSIKRREVPRPGLGSITGTAAVVQGVFGIIVFGIALVILQYSTLFE